MSEFAVYLLWAGLVLGGLYLLLRFNGFWIYALLDRARRNDTTSLPLRYELPRYLKRIPPNGIDFSGRWPGWDGWYFFVLPDAADIPVKMVRGSLMTGLYGLEGIDNYDKVSLRLGNSEEVEFLCLIPTDETFDGTRQAFNHLSHHYLPKNSNLEMKPATLDVAIRGTRVDRDDETVQFGRIQGRWPNYQIEFSNPEAAATLKLQYQGKNILWWADIPGVFTYFAAFGSFEGEICYRRGTHHIDPQQIPDQQETYSLKGLGGFEHGFARKPFDFDPLWSPFRLLKTLAPSLKFVRYHYELFLTGPDQYGGFMLARGFGIDFRNRGGVFWKGSYIEIQNIRIEYPNRGESDSMSDCSGTQSTRFFRKWRVVARTTGGPLEYTATRSFPPAPVASDMIYYQFSFEGHFNGEEISGRGYGEYADI